MTLEELAEEVKRQGAKVDHSDSCRCIPNVGGAAGQRWPDSSIPPKATLTFPHLPHRGNQRDVADDIMEILEEHRRESRKLVLVQNEDGEAEYAFLGADGHIGAVED